MSLSPDIIQTVKDTALIEEVVGDFITLKKKGHYMLACCPFHNEKTPSFTVTPNKGIYKCFGCGKAGDSIQFIMDIEGLSYPETIRYLAAKYGIELKEEETEHSGEGNEKQSLYIVLDFAAQYFARVLKETEEGKSIGYSYFKERGFSDETITHFSLGYSLDEWDGFTQTALKEAYQKAFLVKAGLTIESDDTAKSHKLFDRFRGRVIFPIHNLSGKVIAFGARILKTDKKQAKYLNSPESDVYHKSKVLYGLFQAKQAIRNADNCLLVEGYTDVVSLHQGGVENVVASSGTSLTEDQIKLIGRFTQNVTVLYDGDAAGLKASLRGVDMILAEDLNVKVVIFPEGEDPDSYIKKVGGEAFNAFLKEKSKDLITFKTERSLKEAGNDPLKRAEVIREIVESISKIPDSIKRAVFFKQCSEKLEIDEGVLIAEFNKIQLKARQKQKEPEKFSPEEVFQEAVKEELNKEDPLLTAIEMQEKEIVRLLLKYGNEQIETTNFASYVLTEIEELEFSIPVFQKIIQLIKADVLEFGIIREQQFFSHPDVEIRSLCIELITDRYHISDNWLKHEIFVPTDTEILSNLGFNTLLRLKFRSIRLMVSENRKELQKAEKEGNDTTPFLKIHMQLKEAERALASALGIVISK